jgi:hypothetical protein
MMKVKQWILVAFTIVLSAGQAAAQGSSTTVRAPQQPGETMNLAMVMRWAELHMYLLLEFKVMGRSPVAAIEADFSKLEVRVLRQGSRDSWTTRTLTLRELELGNLHGIAEELSRGKH